MMAVETLTKTVHSNPLPEGWRWFNLAELLLSLETGTRPKGGAIGVESGIPSVSAEHMTPYGTFDFSTLRYVPEDFYEQMSRGHIQRGDILIVKDGATTGKVCVVREDFPYGKAVINEHVFLCRPDTTKVVPEYLFYWLWGADGQRAIKSSFQGAAIGGINQDFVKRITLPLPPLLEQQRIVSILGEQMAAIERARAATKARLEAAKALPAAYLSEVFSSREESEEWQLTLLDEVATLLPSKAIATSGDTEVQAITTACLSEGGFLPSGVKCARMWAHDAKECLVSKGEILVARSNTEDLVGRVSIFEGDPPGAVASDLTIRIWANDAILPEFLAFYLSFLYMTSYWKKRAGGASGSMKKITRGQIGRLEIPIPSDRKVQKSIATSLVDKMCKARRICDSIEDEVVIISSLPEALLRRAFNGDL